MEEAYTALYQEFLRLQALCLKQAAMLQHLTEALRRQQGVAPVLNGESVPIECTDDDETIPKARVYEAARMQTLAPHTVGDADFFSIAGGMDRLQINNKHGEVKQNNHDLAASAAFPREHETQNPGILEELRQAEQQWHSSQQARQTRRPWSSSFMKSEMLSQTGGLMMSGITLQSQVCEFCHAVFPGHTTTRGEFIRHLTTHTT